MRICRSECGIQHVFWDSIYSGLPSINSGLLYLPRVLQDSYKVRDSKASPTKDKQDPCVTHPRQEFTCHPSAPGIYNGQALRTCRPFPRHITYHLFPASSFFVMQGDSLLPRRFLIQPCHAPFISTSSRYMSHFTRLLSICLSRLRASHYVFYFYFWFRFNH